MRMTLGARLVTYVLIPIAVGESGSRMVFGGEYGQEAGPEAEVFLEWMYDHDGP